MKKYEPIEHTADLGIRAWGKDLNGLFFNAALGMYSLIADIKKVKPKHHFTIELRADDKEQLLKDWLSELLYFFNNKGILFCDFEITEISDKHINSDVKGETINTRKHTIRHELKAVTYHNLQIKKEKSLLTTDIIFDV